MIEASHRRWAHALFSPYSRLLLRRHFSAIWLSNPQPDLPPQTPVLLLPNHSTWCDGFFVYCLNQVLPGQRRPYVMMLEEQLQRFWFFVRVGAFSIDPASPAHIRASLRYGRWLARWRPARRSAALPVPAGKATPLGAAAARPQAQVAAAAQDGRPAGLPASPGDHLRLWRGAQA